MGLDTTHNCWHGAYSAFMRWRSTIARAAGLPPLELMDGFYTPIGHGNNYLNPIYWARKQLGDDTAFSEIERSLPIKWDCLKPDPLYELLCHSDCDGEIQWQSCAAIANRLEELLPNLTQGDAGGHIGDWREKTRKFIDGLRLAASKQENVEFH